MTTCQARKLIHDHVGLLRSYKISRPELECSYRYWRNTYRKAIALPPGADDPMACHVCMATCEELARFADEYVGALQIQMQINWKEDTVKDKEMTDQEYCASLKWFILERVAGLWSLVPIERLEARPATANPDNGDPYTPWHQDTERLHFADGEVIGAHVEGTSLEDAIDMANAMVSLYQRAPLNKIRRKLVTGKIA